MALRDRGPARYDFVGRQELRDEFNEFLDEAIEDRSGSTFLVQGPPGVGKTALLHELGQTARGWKVVNIKPDAIHDPIVLAKSARQEIAVSETRGHEAGGKVGFAGTEAGGRRLWSREYAGADVEDVITDWAKEALGVLLILDEAQDIADLIEGVSVRIATKSTLKSIHNGEYAVPVVLLAGGLGHSEHAFESLGIWRFRGGAVVNLGRLSDSASRELVDAYLAEGDRKRQPMKGQRALVHQILERSHGWPQHLVAYGESAQSVLPKERAAHCITAGERGRILDMGDQAREAYYRRRAHRLSDRERALLGALVSTSMDVTRWQETALTNLARVRPLGEARGPDLLKNAVRGGALAEVGKYREFHIPIPSMADWLVDQFEHCRKTEPEVAIELKSAVAAAFPSLARGSEIEPGTKTIGRTRRSGVMRGGLGASSSRDDLER